VWFVYLEFEIAFGTVETINEVLQRGVTSLPWSKTFLMRGLEELWSKIPDAEQRAWYEILEIRELRVRMPVTEEE
jgi:hypothetical protein